MKNLLVLVSAFIFSTGSAFAKNCTESDIRSAHSAGRAFIYSREGCTNANGIITIKKGIKISKTGWKFDGEKIARLVWKGGGKCKDKTPRSSDYAFFDLTGKNGTVANFSAEGAPEGIHVSTGSGNVVDGVVFPEVCEDGITNGNKKSSSATGTVIKDCKFSNSDDKAIQTNGGTITVQDSVFRNVYRSIGMCSVKADPGHHDAKPCGFRSKITALRNTVYGCSGYGMRAAGKDSAKGGTLYAEGNVFHDCDTPIQAEEEGYVEAQRNEFLGSCKQAIKTIAKGTGLYGCGNKNQCRNDFSGNVKKQTGCAN